MPKCEVKEVKNRGDYIEHVILDTTRVGHPVAARIYQQSGTYLIVPDNDLYPVVSRDNISSAIDFIEQIIPDEGRSY